MDLSEKNARKIREQTLRLVLHQRSMQWREDSLLCRNFVTNNKPSFDLETTVRKMEQARFLHEYCNFEIGRQIAINTAGKNRDQYNHQMWLDLVKRCVLATTRYKSFPIVWPWALGISPNQWKKCHDISSHILR
jgi:hypothetical protein